MTNKSFGVKNDFYFGSGSDRLILADTTKRTGLNDESIFMGNGNDDLTHTGTLSGMFVDLGNDHDHIFAKSARQLVVDLGGGNDILNIRQLEGSNRFIGGLGNDIYRLKGFNGNNVIEDSSGVSTLDFTDTLRNKSGQVITSQGYPIKCNGGKWDFTTIQGRNSRTKATPGQAGPSVNSFNFTRVDTKGGYKLIDKEGDALKMNFGAALGHKLLFADGSIEQNPKTGVWTKTVKTKSAKTEVVTTYLNLGLATSQVVNVNLSLTLGSATTENVIGGSLADTLTGNNRNNSLTGGLGKDTLTGGGATDSDTFVYNALNESLLSGYDVITDYTGRDRFIAPFTVEATTLDSSAGNVQSLTGTAISALLTPTAFAANTAAAFTATGQVGTFVALNDGRAGFQADTDSIVFLRGFVTWIS